MKKDNILFSDFLNGYSGKKYHGKYRAEVVSNKDKILFKVYQPIEDDYYLCGTWNYDSIKDRDIDILSIDFGQDWYISGLNKFNQGYEKSL